MSARHNAMQIPPWFRLAPGINNSRAPKLLKGTVGADMTPATFPLTKTQLGALIGGALGALGTRTLLKKKGLVETLLGVAAGATVGGLAGKALSAPPLTSGNAVNVVAGSQSATWPASQSTSLVLPSGNAFLTLSVDGVPVTNLGTGMGTYLIPQLAAGPHTIGGTYGAVSVEAVAVVSFDINVTVTQ